jgi:PleD family two-component response regulator
MAKLLVYDDHTAYWAELVKCLSERHDVTFASDVDEVIEHIADTPFELIVAAVYEDNESVFELLKRVRANLSSKDVPFICVRGPEAKAVEEMDDAFRMATMMLGAQGYVVANDYKSVCPSLEQYLGISAETSLHGL